MAKKRSPRATTQKSTTRNEPPKPVDDVELQAFRRFVVALATNPTRLGEYLQAPKEMMEGAGLSKLDQLIFASSHFPTIHARMSGHAFKEEDFRGVLNTKPAHALAPSVYGAASRSQSSDGPQRGELIVVGTGIRTVGHLTIEAVAWIKGADKVLYVVGDPVAESVIKELNPLGAESLVGMYAQGKPRIETYNQMVERTLECIRDGKRTCLACYGHPGVFVYPSHESIRRARAEGFEARMLPGISSEDCLFADLGVDPGIQGCQSYEATDFLLNHRLIDVSSAVVLWQIGVLGDSSFKADGYDLRSMPLLIERLLALYPATHPMILYEASMYIQCRPTIYQITAPALTCFQLTAGFTLYIPPASGSTTDASMYWRMKAMTGSGTGGMGVRVG